MPGSAPAPGGVPELWRHVRETVALAVPVMAARSGTLAMITTDVIMTGRYHAVELGYYGLGFMAHQVLYVLGQGALLGTTVLTAQAEGMGRSRESGNVWRVALAMALVLGLLLTAVSLLGERFFLASGQTAELAREGGAVTRAFGWGVLPLLLNVATTSYLEGISRPRANMWLMVGAIGLNAALNWLLIYPHAGWTLGGQGAVGAALGTSLTRLFLFLALGTFALLMRGSVRHGARGPLTFPLSAARKLARLGLPLMVAQGLESAAFLAIALFVGWLGAQALAVYQIVNNLFHIVFMLALGVSVATGVRVGNAVGRGDGVGLARAGWSGIGLGLGLLATICAGFHVAPGLLAAVYTGDPGVLEQATPIIAFAGWFLIVDGGQVILVGALRGAGDVVVPSCMVVGGFWGVAVPAAYWLAVAHGGGVQGLIAALIAGAGTATLLLLLRYAQVSRRPVRPV